MHILHGTWLAEEKLFALWGEDTTIDPQYQKGRRGQTAPHPYSVSQGMWLRYLDRFMTDPQPDGMSTTIWLPGLYKHPQPSLIARQHGAKLADTAPEMLAWRIDVILLNINDALDFFLQIPNDTQGSFRLGEDLQLWKQVSLLALNCLAEGRYLPSLSQQGRQFRAYWQAMPDPSLLRQIAENMPAICRAMVEDISQAPQATYLLNHYLSTAVDDFVRNTYAQAKRPPQPWLKALTGIDPILKGDFKSHQALYRAWEEWRSRLAGESGSFRIAFRLSEPPADSDVWTLTYLLQARDDPSLIVPAETVWTAKSNVVTYLEHRFENVHDKLLAGLGFASRLFKPIEDSLRNPQASEARINQEEAYQFLVDVAPVLEQSDFAVLVPNWWGKRAKLRAKARVSETQESSGFLTKDSLLNYEWSMSLGNEVISKAEFEALVALKQPLVRYKGEWVTLDVDQIEATLKFFEQDTKQQVSLLDALRLNAGDDDVAGIEIDETEVSDWLSDIFARLHNPDGAKLLLAPEGLNATLRPYQERGFSWLAQMRQMGIGACLADDMGLGKTLQTITLWLHERENLDIGGLALLVCPTSVLGNWRHEIRKFAPSLRTMTHHGADRLQDADAFIQAVNNVDVVITSYSLLRRDQDIFSQIDWADMVLDEAQNIKNAGTKQAQAARSISAQFKLALTGTPVENRLSELWSILHFLNPGYLGTQANFKSNFAIPIERYGDEQASQTLRQITRPFILRRLKSDSDIIQDLPEKFENKVYCTLSAEQATLYEAEVRESLDVVETATDDMARRGNVLRMLTRLKQICNHPAHFFKEGQTAPLAGRSGKFERLLEMLAEIRENGERALIFTQYAEMGHLLQAYLKDYLMDEVLYLHGGTASKKREEMVERFQAEHGPPVFILSLKAGGTGLTLTAANHVFHYDRWYNPAVENQATDRAFRIGQTKDVQVHKYICLGTLEERIDAMIEHKQGLADSIIGAGESWISELNSEELRDLVTLRAEAMEDYT
ncbi:MAG: DEAD/DEAH box helicase [Phototrophicaceae bacterium]